MFLKFAPFFSLRILQSAQNNYNGILLEKTIVALFCIHRFAEVAHIRGKRKEECKSTFFKKSIWQN